LAHCQPTYYSQKKKTVHIRKGKLVFYSALFTIAAAILSSCLKNVETTPPKPQTYISLLHLAPAAPDIDVYLNNTKSTATPVPSGTFFNRYSPLDPDIYSIVFKKGGGDSVVASIPADIYDSLSYSTLLLFNDRFGNNVHAVRIEDDFSQLSASQTLWRFFHVSPGFMPVDVYLDNNKISSSREYVDNTLNGIYNVFQLRDPGVFTLSIKKAGSDSTILQTNTTFMGGQAYTILLSGTPGGTAQHALAVDILQASN
jgi:hypothetical protein